MTRPSVTLGALTVSADVLDASAGYSCVDGRPLATSASRVVGLTVNGQSVTVPPDDAPVTQDLGALGTLELNQTVPGNGTVTRRALALTKPLGSVVVGEASAGIVGDPCAPAASLPAAESPAPSGPGTARLTTRPRVRAAGRCVRASFVATVTGRHIQRVVFRRDGRRLFVDTDAPFRTLVGPRAGRHRLTARVSFTAASGTPPRTLALRYRNCARPRPAFTG